MSPSSVVLSFKTEEKRSRTPAEFVAMLSVIQTAFLLATM
jgi:hypothetical protein